MKRLKSIRSIRYILYYEFIMKCDISIKDRDKKGIRESSEGHILRFQN